ncbi:CPBP family intramembrane glutamic endopeptidase [Actinoplanes sp. CA-252034]|uniref:CPBP family intramembrane glutamic endopeptidase n=1 Tax=Actinoplanes sp. CA-252034 TaxID=3239906 RepID=UPI003D96DD28
MTAVASTLIALIFAFLLVNTVQGVRRRRQVLAVLAQRRARFFRNSIAGMVVLVLAGAVAVAAHPDLTAADVGWRLPGGYWTDYLYTGYLLVLLIVVHRRSRTGPLSPATAALLPTTTRERRLAGGTAVAFGVGEEFLYRGLLIAVGTELLGLPLWVAAVLGWVLFVAAHAYQGGRGMITVGLLGLIFTMLYLSSMSLLLPMLMHTLWDAVLLLLIRPRRAAGEQVAAETPVIVEPPVPVDEPPVPVFEPLRLRSAAPD